MKSASSEVTESQYNPVSDTGLLRQESLDVLIAIGPDAPREEGQRGAGIAAQLPGAAQPDGGEKQQAQ